tara:strand:+ start:851 stop:2014 length:1164 start_codon:yes stop_codon:yes gene_type:complete
MAKVITTELQHAGASGANITLDSSKNVTVENNLTVDGTTTLTGAVTLPAGTTSDTLSFRNLLINGAMQVNQRGTVANAGNEYGGPDRWKFMKNDGAMTISQDTDVPTGQGFGNSYKIDCTSVAGTAGVQYVHLLQYIEGQDLQRVKKGTSNAEQLTLSFWIKSTKTGTYVAELYDQDNTRHTSKSYTVSTTNTWEKKTITFAADTTGAFGNDNQASLRVILWFYAGSSFQGGTLAGTWASNTDANRAEGQVNAFDNTANNVFVTGIQLEIGDTATDFEHRSYGDELARCQRYYQVKGGYGGLCASGTVAYLGGSLNPTMRATPTIGSTAALQVNDNGVNSTQSSESLSGADANDDGFFVNASNFSGLTSNRPCLMRIAGKLTFAAEL